MKPIPHCPYLGSVEDRNAVQHAPDEGHRCYAQKPIAPVDAVHQRGYCLTGSYWNCAAYMAVEEPTDSAPAAGAESRGPAGLPPRLLKALPWIGVAIVLLAVGAIYGRDMLRPRAPSPAEPEPAALATEQPLASPTSAPAPQTGEGATRTPPPAATPAGAPAAGAAGAMPTVEPGGSEVALGPEEGGIGWWASGEDRAEHLNDSFLYAGFYDGRPTIAAGRFDLRRLRRGAPIRDARLILSGLSEERLDRGAGGTWTVQLLDPASAPDLGRADFQSLYNAPAAVTLFPTLYPGDLGERVQTAFVLDADARKWLEKQAADGVEGIVFRITGPGGGGDTLFAWDSGAGPATRDNGPQLMLSLGAPPETPPPLPTQRVVVATLTPTPANVLTAAADAWTATAVATAVGTYTPLPYPLATPTPGPGNIATAQAQAYAGGLGPLLIYTATPANPATATANAMYATAVAVTTGTFTPVPTNAVTPVLVMPTPEPQNAATAVAQILRATDQARRTGTPTSLPFGAVIATVTPEAPIIIPTPTAENAATAVVRAAQATLSALTVGTYTPIPRNARMATPEPRATPLPLLVQVTPRPTPSPTPRGSGALPAALSGKILFRSDREGGEQFYALDPATGQLYWVTQGWPFEVAQQREARSADGRFQAEVQTYTEFTAFDPFTGSPTSSRSTAVIYVRSNEYGTLKELTTTDRFSYDPSWSPAGDRIAFVARGENDEIYAVNPDGSNLQRLTNNTWEWDKHPSWSPDGKRIAFWSNRDSGRRQLWIMNADGSNQRLLLSSPYNDWDPIWVK